jgi:CheY-like chemotaxis protein
MSVRVSVNLSLERKPKQEKISLHKNQLAEVLNVGTVSIEVIDQGVGMSQDQVATVFEDGTQFDANKLQAGGGSGLGLNIARGIVIEHGGSLTCSSEGIGQGTTFTLCTNLYIDENAPAGESHIADAKNDEETGGDADFTVPLLHVLVVDDSLTNRKLCQRLLQRNGHTTDGASDGKEAVEMVKESMRNGKYYDSILLDYEMPVMNGPDACRLIRKMGCSSYIAGVTGNVMSEDVDHFRSCGANWVIPKPFSLKAMEDQWVEDGVMPFNEAEETMVRVESASGLIEMGDNVAVTFDTSIV